MTDRHAKALTRLEERLWTGPGELSPQTRAAGIDGDPLPDPLAQSYVETIRLHAYKLTYRSGFFGGPYGALLHSVMRGPSAWTVGERELFAAYTSYLNQCPY